MVPIFGIQYFSGFPSFSKRFFWMVFDGLMFNCVTSSDCICLSWDSAWLHLKTPICDERGLALSNVEQLENNWGSQNDTKWHSPWLLRSPSLRNCCSQAWLLMATLIQKCCWQLCHMSGGRTPCANPENCWKKYLNQNQETWQ